MIALPPPDVALSFMNLQENLPSFFPLKNDAHYAIKRIKLDQQEFSLKTIGVFSEESKTWSDFCPIFPRCYGPWRIIEPSTE